MYCEQCGRRKYISRGGGYECRNVKCGAIAAPKFCRRCGVKSYFRNMKHGLCKLCVSVVTAGRVK